jgi:hypothetical protein
MLALAEFSGVDLDALWILSRKVQMREAEYDRAFGSSRRAELEQLIAELAKAYKRMERAVERCGEA